MEKRSSAPPVTITDVENHHLENHSGAPDIDQLRKKLDRLWERVSASHTTTATARPNAGPTHTDSHKLNAPTSEPSGTLVDDGALRTIDPSSVTPGPRRTFALRQNAENSRARVPASLGPPSRGTRIPRGPAPVLDLSISTPSHSVDLNSVDSLSSTTQSSSVVPPMVKFDCPSTTKRDKSAGTRAPKTANNRRTSSKTDKTPKAPSCGTGPLRPSQPPSLRQDDASTPSSIHTSGHTNEHEDEEESFEELRKKAKRKHQSQKIFRAISRSSDCATVNEKPYVKLEEIGEGGSCTVYKVMGTDLQLRALKCVKWTGKPDEAVASYKNEIAVLEQLKGLPNVVQLIDYEIKKQAIYLVLELGEINLNDMIRHERRYVKEALRGSSEKEAPFAISAILNSGIGINIVRLIWQQMLEAVHTIHEARIVHKDLKPANFVCFQGRLKLIDFGIANAISSDTTNIYQDNALGTANYMSPEQLRPTDIREDGTDTFKIGRASDIWSLGCILYQMVYGRPPFHKYRNLFAKIGAITGSSSIDFPEMDHPQLLDAMQRCLKRDPNERATIPQLLRHPWLR